MILRKSFKKREEELLHEISLLKNINDNAKSLIKAYRKEVEVSDEIIENQRQIIAKQNEIIESVKTMLLKKGTDRE